MDKTHFIYFFLLKTKKKVIIDINNNNNILKLTPEILFLNIGYICVNYKLSL